MSENQESKKQFSIQKLYVKDVSFESPGSPGSFSFKQWEPKIDLNLSNQQHKLEGPLYEVVLTATATVTQQDATAFLVEVHQAGIFSIEGFNDEETRYLLGTQCMNILFPYLREAVSDLSVRGGFPPLMLTPVNFDALYQQHLQQQKQQQAQAEEAGAQ
jgi:preprotein translocase subunit SecB